MVVYLGHTLPGGFFICWGLWHVVNLYTLYFKCKRNGTKFYVPTTFPVGKINFPIEAAVKILAPILGILSELSIGINSEKGRIQPKNTVHIAMFTAYALSGVTDILCYYNTEWIPRHTDRVMTAIAFGIEGINFSMHRHPLLHGATEPAVVQMTVHGLLVDVILATAILILVEIFVDANFLLALCRSALMIVQGTWLCQIEWILSPFWNNRRSGWDLFSHDSSMYCVMIFSFNLFGCLIVIGLSGFIISRRFPIGLDRSYRRVCSPD